MRWLCVAPTRSVAGEHPNNVVPVESVSRQQLTCHFSNNWSWQFETGVQIIQTNSGFSVLSLHLYSYRKNHSTETAVLKVITDVLHAADRGEVTLLSMLDLSCMFDTVDHGILLDCLRCAFGVQGVAISWIESFLQDRTQSISPTNSRLQWS